VDEPVVEKSFDPPILVQRIFAGAAVAAFVVRLIVEPGLRNALWAVALCPLFVFVVVRPKAVRDGRLDAWDRRHPVVLAGVMAVFAAIAAYLLFSLFLSDRLSVAIAVVLGIAYCGTTVYRTRHWVG
jgi:small-conductance mechanosensitive channel